VLEVLYHHAKFGEARISPATGAAKNLEYFVVRLCLFPVTLGNVRVCAYDFAMKVGAQKWFYTARQGKVCNCAPVFDFLRLPPTGDTTKCLSLNKYQKAPQGGCGHRRQHARLR